MNQNVQIQNLLQTKHRPITTKYHKIYVKTANHLLLGAGSSDVAHPLTF